MAFDITNKARQVHNFVPRKSIELTDQTATTGNTAADFGTAGGLTFRAYVALTSFTEPDPNLVTSFALEVSNSNTFDFANTAVYTLDSFVVIPASLQGRPTIQLIGNVPVQTAQQFARIVVLTGTNGAVNFDAIIDAA